MIETVKITKVFISDKKKDGTEYKSKKGEKFWKIGIKTDKHGEDWFSALAFKEDDRIMNLQEGDEVTIDTEINGEFKNFKLPSRLDLLEARVAVLEANSRTNKDVDPIQVDAPPLNDNDIPF